MDAGCGDGLCCLQGFIPFLCTGVAEVSMPEADSSGITLLVYLSFPL